MIFLFIRCIQLIEPALTDIDARQIERLISIYVAQDATKSSSSDESSTDDKIYTVDEILHGNANVPAKPCADVNMDSIWRVAPGM